MAKQTINIGTTANDGTGDNLRASFTKANQNFTELYGAFPEIGDWVPVLTFVTPGDLAVTYSVQAGRYVKIGKLVMVEFTITTSTFTRSTAVGNLQVTGLPYAAETVSGMNGTGALSWSGITKTGIGQIVVNLPSADNKLTFRYSGTGIAAGLIAVADVPSGGTVALRGSISYIAA